MILVQKVDITEKSIDELRVQENSMQREKDRVNQISIMQQELESLKG